MSRQFYVYLLPADVETVIQRLSAALDIVLLQPWSMQPRPVQLNSPILNERFLLKHGSARVDCYLAPSADADLRMHFVSGQSRWLVDLASEVIEFRGCEFDDSVLVRGRLYLADDLLVGDQIIPKRRDFLRWANQLFRLAKRSLRRDKALDAYVGDEANKWRQRGGRFASTVTPQRGPIYAPAGDIR